MGMKCVYMCVWHLWTYVMLYALGAWYLFKELFSKHRKPTDIGNQRGRVAVVTGGGRGIGLEAVKQFLELDMTVVIAARNTTFLQEAVDGLRAKGVDGGRVECLELDLTSLASVRKFVKSFLALKLPLNVLVNNAGIMFWPWEETEDGHEAHWSVNYLGHFLLTHLLWPTLKASSTPDAPSKVVNLSSSVSFMGSINFEDVDSKAGYNTQAAYAQSKLAQLMFTIHLDGQVRASGESVIVNAVHPGVVATELFERVGWVKLFPWLARALLKTPRQGSDTVVHVALSESVCDGGHYYENCTITRPPSNATRTQDLTRLWDLTCSQLSVNTFGES